MNNGENMRGKRSHAFSGIVMAFMLLAVPLLFQIPAGSGYDDVKRTSLGRDKDDYELILDVPWRIRKGRDIPVLLLVHDGDERRVHIKTITVTFYDDTDGLLFTRTFNATELGDPMGNDSLIIDEKMWFRELFFSPGSFVGQGSDYVGMTKVEAVFSFVRDDIPVGDPAHETRTGDMEIIGESLDSIRKWYLGEAHAYSNYTDTDPNDPDGTGPLDHDSKFGAPIVPTSNAGKSIELDWIAFTDNSTGFSGEGEYNARTGEMAGQTAQQPRPLLLPAQEVICRNNGGGLPTPQNGKILVYGADFIQSGGDIPPTFKTASEVMTAVQGSGGAAYIEELFLDNVVYGPWNDIPGNITGMEIWMGGDPYTGTNARLLDRWTSLLLEGRRLYASAGSACYGEFSQLGRVRTLAYLPDGLEQEALVKALRWGHTVITNGPLCTFTGENETGKDFVIGENTDQRMTGKEIIIDPKFSCDEAFGEIEEAQLHIGVVGGSETVVDIPVEEENIDITPYLPPNQDAYVRMSVNSSDGVKAYHALTNPMWVRHTNIPPVADAGGDQEVYVDEEVEFEGTGDDADGTVMNYEWDFEGDGEFEWSSGMGGAAKHTYDSPGTYTATFRVTDDNELWAEDNCSITVLPVLVNTAPRVDAGNDVTIMKGDKVTLRAKVEDDENNVDIYEWSLEGTVVSKNLEFTHTFKDVGTFIFTFTATDSGELSGSDTVSVTVQLPPNDPPLAVLTVTATEVYEREKVTFYGMNSSDPEGRDLEYNFIFGDGEESGWGDEDEVEYAYTKAKRYEAYLEVRDDAGQVAESGEITITVSVKPRDNTDDGKDDEDWISKTKDYVKKNTVLVVGIAVGLVILMIVIIFLRRLGKGSEEMVFKRVGTEGEADESTEGEGDEDPHDDTKAPAAEREIAPGEETEAGKAMAVETEVMEAEMSDEDPGTSEVSEIEVSEVVAVEVMAEEA